MARHLLPDFAEGWEEFRRIMTCLQAHEALPCWSLWAREEGHCETGFVEPPSGTPNTSAPQISTNSRKFENCQKLSKFFAMVHWQNLHTTSSWQCRFQEQIVEAPHAELQKCGCLGCDAFTTSFRKVWMVKPSLQEHRTTVLRTFLPFSEGFPC